MKKWQRKISKLIMSHGKYAEAAEIALEHGLRGVRFAMDVAHNDGSSKGGDNEFETLYNWDTVPSWVNWIATDEDGEVWGYDIEPELHSDSIWSALGSRAMTLGVVAADDFRESLEMRPNLTKYNWDLVPDTVQWLATDEDGSVWGYGSRPRVSSALAAWTGLDARKLSNSMARIKCEDYRKSLEERPK